MKIGQKKWKEGEGWKDIIPLSDYKSDLVLVFGERKILGDEDRFNELKKFYPFAEIVTLSTAGNIEGINLDDHSLIATAIHFEKGSSVDLKRINIDNCSDSFDAGKSLGQLINVQDLKHLIILSDGHLVNGADLLQGIIAVIPAGVSVTGGLAGDGTGFKKTVVGLNQPPKQGEIVAISFYGPHLKFGFGSVGGWDPFGLERKITKAHQNRLYELDGQPALELYKKYLGEHSKNLPGSALLFPLSVKPNKESSSVVRTILTIDNEDNAMVFAGNIPEGGYAQLMKANFDRLVDGAAQAAEMGNQMMEGQPVELALLISCIGRRLVLDQRVEEELESVREVIGKKAVMAGFYSYGEIAPMNSKEKGRNPSELHNQTMTITTLAEI